MKLESGSFETGRLPALSMTVLLCLVALSLGAGACASDGGTADSSQTAAADDDGSGKLEPRYQPREPVPEPFYNGDYLFAMSRGVANSTIHPAGKLPLLVLTIPFDIVFLPFAAIAGFF